MAVTAPITEQQKAALFDLLWPQLPLGIAILAPDLSVLWLNQTQADWLQVDSATLQGQCFTDIQPQLTVVLQQVRSTASPQLSINFSSPADSTGQQQHWQCRCLPLLQAGELSAIAVLTEQINQSQQQGLQRLRQVLDNLCAFVGMLRPNGPLLDANRSPLEAADIALSAVLQKNSSDCCSWQHNNHEQQRIAAAVCAAAQEELCRFDVTAQMKEQIMTLDFMLAPLYDEQGQLRDLLPSAMDISDRTRSETELRDSELRFRRVFDSAADGLICVDQQGRITLCNPRALEMFGYSAEELNNQPIEMLVPSELTAQHQQHRQHYLRQPSSRRMSERTELYARRKDGSLFPVDIGLTQLNITGDAKVLATVTDITAQKLAQQKLQLIVDEKSQLLHERTTLLNEVHHRVKNNLQIISSLLNLQGRHAGPEVRQALTESQLRVRTMALTHQLLYEKRDFSSITLGAYLQQLCQLVRQSLSQQCQIQFDFSAVDQHLVLALQQAIPCGLFVNEVLTNALKHAFPGRSQGLIRLELSQQQDSQIRLAIIDDGIGLSESAQLGQGQSLGFQLIPTFITQLRAELELQRQPGTGFVIRFMPLQEPL